MKRTILQVRPDFGGIADYGDTIKKLYERAGYDVTVLPCPASTPARRILAKIDDTPSDLIHFEIGASQTNLFWVSWRLSHRARCKQMATIHDPGMVVKVRTVPLEWDTKVPQLARLPLKVVRKVANLTTQHRLIPRWVRDRRIPKFYLRRGLIRQLGGQYLPQPTYHATPPELSARRHSPLRIGFAGYWQREKGVETLLDAIVLCKRGGYTNFKLVLGGGGVLPQSEFVDAIKHRAETLGVPLEMPGFVAAEKLDEFLQGLSVLVLPYWPELPSGASAMSMRAAELGTPIIASDTPPLAEQLGPEGARYVKPRDPVALSETIIDFLQRPQIYWEAARRAQIAIFRNHSWSAVSEILDRAARDVIEARP
jgi:glycosyltransferase involved in cell wall biosynthesis